VLRGREHGVALLLGLGLGGAEEEG